MTRLNESPKEKIYARCDSLGVSLVRKKLEDPSDNTFLEGEDYAHSWLKEHDEKEKQEERLDKALAIAEKDSDSAKKSANASLWSAVASIISAIIALIALLAS